MTPERWKLIDEMAQAALDREGDERAAFLDEACAADEELRREVESQIAYQQQASKFLEDPAFKHATEMIADPQTESMEGRTIGHYRILRTLGRGGMGDVYLAEDTRLKRKVALKLLPGEFTQDHDRVRRFEQEAQAASALNHPNIITIHEIGEVAGTHYIVTEYVAGETLRARMKSEQPDLDAALEIVLQIASALAVAHQAGIIHRDIKPENVMVRDDGLVKVLDFGLAKLTGPQYNLVDTQAPTKAHQGTASGVVLGTAGYMSPEQARGLKVDARTDIFSLGVMLYEMIAGHKPFEGATTSDVIAAVLLTEPQPLTHFAPEVPERLEFVVGKALAKAREDRHQTVKDLAADLKGIDYRLESGKEREDARQRSVKAASVITSGQNVSYEAGRHDATVTGGGAPIRTISTARRVVAVLNGRKLAASLALAALAIAAVGAFIYFSRKPILTEKDTIVLADFENKTGDDVFDGALKQGLAIQLQQSPFLNIFPEAGVRQTLGLMGRPANERVTTEIAREICVRNNLKALIAGAIAPLGSHYVITLEAINGQSGESLARQQGEADSREQVMQKLSQGAAQLREELGESLGSIKQFDRPLEKATTPKLEAFKAYTDGLSQSASGKVTDAILFYQRAVAIDPEFAGAYSSLSVSYGISGRPQLAAVNAAKAYALRDRVTEFEKLRIDNFYHAFATGNLNKRIDALMLLTSPIDLALTYNQIGEFDQAVARVREAFQHTPEFAKFAPAHRILGWALLRLNRFAEAKDVVEQALQQKLDTTDFHAILYQIAFTDGDLAAMQRQIEWLRGKPDEYVTFDWQTGAAAFAGQWRKSQGFARSAIDRAAGGDTNEVAARYATEQAIRAAVFGDRQRAVAAAKQGLKFAGGRASGPRAALALALCGETNQAKPLVDELSNLYPEDTVINSIWLPTIRAALELQRGDAVEAIEQLRASRYEAAAEFWPQYLRGQANLKLRKAADAAADFQKILDHRGEAPLSPLYSLADLGIARALALSGDTVKSRKAYEDFFALWKDADAHLPILIEAKKEYQRLK